MYVYIYAYVYMYMYMCIYEYVYTFRQNTKKSENSNLHGFEQHRPSSKGTKLLFQVIKSIIHQTEYIY